MFLFTCIYSLMIRYNSMKRVECSEFFKSEKSQLVINAI